MPFQISALAGEQFEHLFAMSQEQLAATQVIERTANEENSFPCRVSLEDAKIGEQLLLVNFEHLPVNSPYRSRHAIYVRRGARTAHPAENEIPGMLRSRTLSVRGFDPDGIMLEAEICPGNELEHAIQTSFANPAVNYLHVHFAGPGCYAARIDRA